ncbi:MAG: hypothetical protein AAGB31_15230 [Bdellovibrio sp.]
MFVCPTLAANCLLSEALKDPQLTSNAKFWEEISKLNEKDFDYNDSLKKIIAKHSTKVPNSPSKQAKDFQNSARLSVVQKAEKEIKNLPPHLKEKVDEFIETALQNNGLQSIRDNPGRWNLEKTIQFGENSYTARISQGYRVLFDYDGENLQIRRINKGQIHGN